MAKRTHNQSQGTFGEFESVPNMPEGFFAGDQPNPSLRAFIDKHSTPFNPEKDTYKIQAFNEQITTSKVTAVYNLHTYWSKKPHDAIRQYVRHYARPGDLVLDPFCGSGGTALSALMDGRKAVALDRSPAATFITANSCVPLAPNDLHHAMSQLKKKVQADSDWLYGTTCDGCDGPAMTYYTVYSTVFQCPRCMKKLPLFDCAEVEGQTQAGKPKKVMVCPYCLKKGNREEISTRAEKFPAVPVLVSYTCLGGCSPARRERRHNDSNAKCKKYFEEHDMKRLAEIEASPIPYWYPPHKMMNVEDQSAPWGAEWRQGRNFRTVAELFTRRNLWALAALRNAISDGPAKGPLMFAFTGILLGMSRMNRHRPDVSYPTAAITDSATLA